MGELASDIRRIAREMFDGKRIDLLVGFEKGSDGYRSRPVFLESAEGADRLTWDATCSQNLAVYLPSLFRREPQKKGAESAVPRVAFVVKACDMRALFGLVKEKQAPRENLFVIGVPCRGLVDARKLEKAVRDSGGDAEVTELVDGEETIGVRTADGRSLSLAREPLVQDACLDCQFPVPQGADVLIEGPGRWERWRQPVEAVCRALGNRALEICEPFYGQDGNYTINLHSYTKLNAGGAAWPHSATTWTIVKDNVTELIGDENRRRRNS